MGVNESGFRNLVSGQTNGVLASSLHGLERCVARLWAGDSYSQRTVSTGLGNNSTRAVPVISVGNLTTGGTGKTPLVALVCDLLRQANFRPGIVSRGYGSVDGNANDEKLVLNLLCPDVPHTQAPDRVAAAHSLTIEENLNAIVMDDGFQHRRLHRDLDIVLIDATNPFGYGSLLPRGLLREPLSSLRRADVAIITRSDLVAARVLAEIHNAIIEAAPQLVDHVLHIVFQPTSLRISTER